MPQPGARPLVPQRPGREQESQVRYGWHDFRHPQAAAARAAALAVSTPDQFSVPGTGGLRGRDPDPRRLTSAQPPNVITSSAWPHGGSNDVSNLRAACAPCHKVRTAQQDGGFRRTGPLRTLTGWDAGRCQATQSSSICCGAAGGSVCDERPGEPDASYRTASFEVVVIAGGCRRITSLTTSLRIQELTVTPSRSASRLTESMTACGNLTGTVALKRRPCRRSAGPAGSRCAGSL